VNPSQTGKFLFAIVALFAIPFPRAQADDFDSSGDYVRPSRPGFHAVERLGITLGGSTISKVTHQDGAIREITAGGLYQIGLGVLYQADAIPLSAALTLNYHYNSDYNNNNNASFRRIPLEALAYFNGMNPFRVGGGMRYIYAARANADLNGVSERITFENTRGSVVEIGYQVTPYGWVNLRYVKETYKVATYATTGTTPVVSGMPPYNGSHVGLFITYEY